jgi:hydroxypyruvate reductase
MTEILLKSGANIDEINAIRKHLDQVKGGGLAVILQPAHVQTLVLSDVIGDRLDVIASGPTVPDPSTYQDALDILGRYDVLEQVPSGILQHLELGREGVIPDTLKPGQLPSEKISNHLVGTNFLAAQAAYIHAKSLGYHTAIISTALTGLTENVADFLKGTIQTALANGHPVTKPVCLIFGGEPTVNVTGKGLGGRNMDLALRMVPRMAEMDGVLFVSLATDGEDGPTDAAGAVADALVFNEGREKFGLNIDTYIQDNDAYHYFERVGGLIKTGATGTNVNDLILILIDQ